MNMVYVGGINTQEFGDAIMPTFSSLKLNLNPFYKLLPLSWLIIDNNCRARVEVEQTFFSF